MLSIPILIKEIVEMIVDDPTLVVVEDISGSKSIIIDIKVPKSEIRKVIGKKGKMISCIRTIFRNIGSKNKKRIMINIIE